MLAAYFLNFFFLTSQSLFLWGWGIRKEEAYVYVGCKFWAGFRELLDTYYCKSCLYHTIRTVLKRRTSFPLTAEWLTSGHELTDSPVNIVLCFEFKMAIENRSWMKTMFIEVIAIWIWEWKPAVMFFFLRHLLLSSNLWPFKLRSGRDGAC